MKKITIVVMAMFLTLTFYPGQSTAAVTREINPSTLVVKNPVEEAKVKSLEIRLTEIDKMDKSKMKPAEKRELRKEVRSIKKQITEIGGGV